MSHAFKVVYPKSFHNNHEDSSLSELFAKDLSTLFCTDIGEKGTNAFHFLFASDIQDYFTLCKHYQKREDNLSSALTEEEILKLSPYLSNLEKQEPFGELSDRGSDIYTVSAWYKGTLFVSCPVIRSTKEGSFYGEKDSVIESWGYNPLEKTQPLSQKIQDMTLALSKELQITRPLLFGFSVDDSGNSLLAEIIPNFGLSNYSLLPTILRLNAIDLKEFLLNTYKIL